MNNQEIAHRRLYKQGLTKQIFKSPADVVSQLGAVQAQDYAGAKWALGQRLKDFTDADLDQAFNDGSILRTHLLRPTWHFVTPEDIRWLLMLTAPRVHVRNALMYRNAGLDTEAIKRTNTLIEKFLRGGNFLTRTEIAAALEKAGISTVEDLRLTYIMMRAELDGVICSGPRKGKQFTYALLEERAPAAKELPRDEALAEIIRRYFKTRGPASLQDFCVWSGLTMADAKQGIEMTKSEFKSEMVKEQPYWFVDQMPRVGKRTSTAHLLPNYDEYFIGFKDRSAIGEFARQANISSDDPSFLANIIILDGQVVGGWKRTINKNEVLVETTLITKFGKDEKQLISDAANRFGKFLDLPVTLIHKEYSLGNRKARSL